MNVSILDVIFLALFVGLIVFLFREKRKYEKCPICYGDGCVMCRYTGEVRKIEDKDLGSKKND